MPPVGTHSTVLQLGQTTTVWEWLNTVVLQQGAGNKGLTDAMLDAHLVCRCTCNLHQLDPTSITTNPPPNTTASTYSAAGQSL